MTEIDIGRIVPNPDQPRKSFDPDKLQELAASIKKRGLLQPITVRPVAGRGGKFMIVAGERRYRAHKLNGSKTIPCIVRKMDDRETKLNAIVENLQRDDIEPMEEARAFQGLVDMGLSAEEIAEQLGLAAFRVRWRLQLLNLSAPITKLFEKGHLDRQQALELARLPKESDQHRVLKLVSSGKLTGWKAVRQAVDTVIEAKTQADIFGDLAPQSKREDLATLTRMEHRIEQVAGMIGCGWKNGECVIASKVNPDRARLMADRLRTMQSALRDMERDLRNVQAQAEVLV